ncbi:MAG: vitamin B12 dependent methionine synthase, partial [Candidatus Aminicenantes bacterium]|nr:vitamin B12 dependent methionine synthase [Candidatus Aminicenantes bacterium]
SSISPGSLTDWPIEEQKPLFSLFGDTQNLIGVILTPQMLMIPKKTISGIFFPTKEKFIPCRLCSRQDCPEREAPYAY